MRTSARLRGRSRNCLYANVFLGRNECARCRHASCHARQWRYCVKARVLIVDDEALLVRTLSQAFHDAGYEVTARGSAEQAAEVLATAGRFDLLLLDNRLPGKSGVELLEEIAPLEGTRVVLMTAYDTLEIQQKSERLGVDLYLKKPFDLSSLLSEAARLLEKEGGEPLPAQRSGVGPEQGGLTAMAMARKKKRTTKKKAAKKRTTKKRVAKKRVAKKRTTKKRVAKKRGTKKRVAKKRVAKKRPAKKRATKKRVAKKRVAKKRVAKKRPARKRAKKIEAVPEPMM